jgi:hypothetical protein
MNTCVNQITAAAMPDCHGDVKAASCCSSGGQNRSATSELQERVREIRAELYALKEGTAA